MIIQRFDQRTPIRRPISQSNLDGGVKPSSDQRFGTRLVEICNYSQRGGLRRPETCQFTPMRRGETVYRLNGNDSLYFRSNFLLSGFFVAGYIICDIVNINVNNVSDSGSFYFYSYETKIS